MSGEAGDRARVSMLVKVPPGVAFRAFTEEIDQWWGRGRKYRVAGDKRGIIHIEPKLGGRLFESFESGAGDKVIETGRVAAWEPPARLLLEWRSPNFAPGEKTFVEVLFEESVSGTLVTVTHSGFAALRPDHPVRHGRPDQEFLRWMGMWWADLMTLFKGHVE